MFNVISLSKQNIWKVKSWKDRKKKLIKKKGTENLLLLAHTEVNWKYHTLHLSNQEENFMFTAFVRKKHFKKRNLSKRFREEWSGLGYTTYDYFLATYSLWRFAVSELLSLTAAVIFENMLLLHFNVQALDEPGWNFTVTQVSSKAINASWLPLNTNNSDSSYIYGYLVILQKLLNGTGDILLLDLAHNACTVVSGLRPYTKYQVRAVALLRDRGSSKISLKTSESTEIQTAEGGEWLLLHQ